MPYICPVCQSALLLHQASKGYYCKNKHHFDLAKEGYLNLLPVQHKKSKEPGDSREMMRARRNFLEAGYFQPLAQEITKIIDKQISDTSQTQLLDVGCGEGYYSRQIEANSEKISSLDLHGVDIAKNAILAAAKRQSNGRFIVASNKSLPYKDDFFDILLKVYAPSNDIELTRILKAEGFMLFVTPGPRHLWQLKEFIYKAVKEHSIDVKIPSGFQLIDSQSIRYKIQPSQDHRMALLQMTPFAWRVKGQIMTAIQRANQIEIETDFILTLASNKK